jgi:protein TonB
VSVLAHAAVIGIVMVPTLWAVKFPDQAPGMMTMYSLVEPPPLPPPPPPPPAPPKATQTIVTKDTVSPTMQFLAPTIIPDTIPEVSPVSYVEGPVQNDPPAGGVEGGVVGGVAGGTLGGSLDGIEGGDIGGKDGGVVGSVDGGRVVVPRDATLRMHALSKTFPMYPENARIRGWEADVIVRYVIGIDGKVKEVTILNNADRKVFDDATINAIRYWRFRPMVKDGKAVEVVHELTIKYRLNA